MTGPIPHLSIAPGGSGTNDQLGLRLLRRGARPLDPRRERRRLHRNRPGRCGRVHQYRRLDVLRRLPVADPAGRRRRIS